MTTRRNCQIQALETVKSRYTAESETNLQLCTGAGKSIIEQDISLLCDRCIIVVPSLLLLAQYYRDHKQAYDPANLYYMATEGTLDTKDKTTNRILAKVKRLSDGFVELSADKFIVLTTYASAPQIYEHISNYGINVDILIEDEAQHIEGPKYKEAFALVEGCINHRVRMSATLPSSLEKNYTYSLLRGIKDGVVRDFTMELVICKSGEKTQVLAKLVDLLIAVQRIHGRVAKILVYTAFAEKDDASSVVALLGEYRAEAERRGWWMKGIYDSMPEKKQDVLEEFETSTCEAAILVSCKTLSEGVDLKNANCMIPWDPTNSTVDNIQRIGRIVRLYKMQGAQQTLSTIAIPVFLDEEDYCEHKGDKEATHTVLERQIALGERGNFKPIINVCTALKSELADEDEDLFNELLDARSHSPPRVHIDKSLIDCVAKKLKKKPAALLKEIAGELEMPVEDLKSEWSEEDEEQIIEALVKTQDITLRVDDGDEVQSFGSGGIDVAVIRDGDSYKVQKDGKGKKHVAKRLNVHFTADCMVMLGLEDVDIDGEKQFVFGRLTTEVCPKDIGEERAMMRAKECVEWSRENGYTLPNKRSQDKVEKTLGHWIGNMRSIVKGNTSGIAYPNVIQFLDNNIPDWNKEQDHEETAMQNAVNYVKWRQDNIRKPNKNERQLKEGETKEMFDEERRLCEFINGYRKAQNNMGSVKLYPTVTAYLDTNCPDWSETIDYIESALEKARECVIWSKAHNDTLPKEIKGQVDSAAKEQTRLARWLGNQKKAFNGKNKSGIVCFPSVKEYLDLNLPGWIDDWKTDAIKIASICVEYYNDRGTLPSTKIDTEFKSIKEQTLANFINGQRQKIKNKHKAGELYPEVIEILDNGIPNWRSVSNYEERAMLNAITLKIWINNKGIRPLSTAKNRIHSDDKQKEKNIEEARLGTFLDGCKKGLKGQGTNKLYPSVKAYLDEHIPGWAGSDTLSVSSVENTIQAPAVEAPAVEAPAPIQPRRRKFKLPNPEAEPSDKGTLIEQLRARRKSDLEKLHQRYKSMNSATFAAHFAANPQEFHTYHAVAEKRDALDLPERKVMTRLAIECAKLPSKCKVADLGCGKNQLRTLVPQCKWTSVDAVAIDDTVQVADLAALPFDDCHFQAAVLSRALWSRDHPKQLAEAYRVLNYGAPLIVCESWGRWRNEDGSNQLIDELKNAGFTIKCEPNTKSDEPFQYIIAQKPALL